MHDPHALLATLLLLAAAVAAVALSRAVRTSPVLGYLAAGLLIGPTALGLFDDVRAAAEIAELGVVFLLFTIGLELPLKRLRVMRRYVFGLGMAQVLATGTIITGVAMALGVSVGAAVLIGGGLALSSTAMVSQLLIERGELSSRAGRGAFSILLAQDIAVVPLLAAAGVLAGGAVLTFETVAIGAGEAIAVIGGVILFGRFLLRPALRVAARPGPGAADLFTALALLLVLGISYAAGAAGVSMAMGAFLAGLMLADTEFKHQIEADLRPFRGLLLGLFFMTVGMQMDLRLVMDRPLDLALLVVLGLTLKVVVTAGLARLFGFSAGQSGQIGLLTAQGGEFAFVLFAAGAAALPAEARSLLPAAIVIGMVMTPALAALGAKFARRMDLEDHGEPSSPAAEGSPRNHVVICGFGRVGQTLGRMASGVNAPWLALDMAPHRIAEARKRELPVFFGDAAREDVLRAIHIDHAAVAAVTIDDPQAALQTVSALKRVAPQIKIVARAQDPNHAQALYAAGAARATPELLEGSLQLAASMMRGLGREDEEIDREVELFREEARTRLEDLIPADPRKRGKTA